MNHSVHTVGQLTSAIESASDGDIIYLNGETYTFTEAYASYTGPDTSALPELPASLTIVGDGAVFERDSVEDFRFIYTEYSLKVQGVTFREGYLWDNSGGGAIYVLDADLSLIECVFDNNQTPVAIGYGGAVRVSGYNTKANVYIQNCLFVDNLGFSGGALNLRYNFSATILNTRFHANNAVIQGSAIYAEGTFALAVEGCVFENHETKAAIYINNDSETEIPSIHGCRFVNNNAASGAQATCVYAVTPITLNHNIFTKNNLSTPSGIPTVQLNAAHDATLNYWGATDGPSGDGTGSGEAYETSATENYIPFLEGVDGVPEHNGTVECPCNYASKANHDSGNPISLLSGEKRLEATDLQVNTPLGVLAFTRRYRQSLQDSLDFMGLGWTHNHVYGLVEAGGSPNKITVTIAGSTVIFYDDNTDDTFEAAAGSTSVIVKASSEYDLTASDESVYHFDSAGRLSTRTLNNGEVWSYSYDGSGNLTQVSDGYGRSLEFAYYSGLMGGDAFKNGQLWRVGTHTSSDLVNSPQTPYIELDYSDDGTGEALLTDVQDVRGENWTYRYYGSEMSETDSKWLNFMVERFSPSVDSDGDGSPDGTITLEDLSYSGTARDAISQIVQNRGDSLMSKTLAFDPDNDLTTETVNGVVISHEFLNGVYLGTRDGANNRQSTMPQSNYRPVYQLDAKGNATQMSWSSDGKKLEGVMDASGNETAFSYDSLDRLIASTDPEGRVTNYVYEGSRRQPSQILVAAEIASDLAINGDMEDNSDWSAVGSPTTSQQSQTEVSDGENSWYLDGASGEGIETSATIAFTADKTYLITARVYADTGMVQMGVDGNSNWDVASQDNDVWETLRAIYTPTSGFSAQLQFLASGAAQFYVDSVHVLELSALQRWQQFVYDDKARTLEDYLLDHETAVALQSTVRVYGTSGNGNGLLESITVKDLLDSGNDSTTQYDYDEQGRVIRSHKISMFGSCEYTHTVYDAAGNVLGTACGLVTDSPLPASIIDLTDLYDVNDASKKHTRVSTHVYDEMGRRVQTTSNAGATFARSNRTIYDALGRVVRTIQNYVQQGSSAPGDWLWDAGDERWEDGAGNAISFGSELDENIISVTDYNGRGLVYRRRDVLGRVTLYGYNNADRLVKTVQNAATPAYDMTYATGDPDLSDYSASSNADEDLITQTVYDANGNVVKSIDVRGSVTFTVYDALNRPIKVMSNAAQPGYDILSDLSLVSYGDYSTDPDKDMVSVTEYDALGRVIRSQRLLENRGDEDLWDTMLYGYDTLGRQVASLQHASNPDYDMAADPDLSEYSISSDPDVDMWSETIYDVQGRVFETLDLNGRINRMVYDGLNRQVLTIANYVTQGTEPENWLWDAGDNRWEDGSGNAIDHGTNNDQNIISETVYDSDGRVESTRNVEGLVSQNAYDLAGRSSLRVQNFVAQATQPENWEWANNQWEDGSSTAIARGSNFDQNLISQPDYDDEQRVFQTRDARGNLNRMVYDESGRQVMSIANYVAQTDGSSNPVPPETWYWDNAWKGIADVSSAVVTIDHGANKDQNRISETQYDLLGRSFRTRDVVGRKTYTVYDAVGRVIRRVQNYVVQGSTIPDDWEWDAADKRYEDGSGNAIALGSNNDQNIISETEYNQAGQVVSTRDAFGTQSSFVYDAAGRRLQVVQASNTGLATASYTCFDKAGRVLRSIANYLPYYDEAQSLISPDAWDDNGNWLFHPEAYVAREQNIISEMTYDRASRQIQSINPMGDTSTTTYYKDGQVKHITDAEGMVTAYRYDALRRRILVVQSFVDNGEDPQLWVWDAGDTRYEKSGGTAIAHGTENDENIIVMVAYDIAGRMTSMRDPRGNLTSYTYDKLGRRTSLSNPLSKVWSTAYAESNGALSTTMSYPGVNAGSTYDVVRDFDRMGRLTQIDYNDAANTAVVQFAYDVLGNRLNMSENNGTSDIRITDYSYDQLNRLSQVDFDSDADTVVEETVSYEYDIRGLRSKLTMTGGLDIVYRYDAKGRLIALEDWDNQTSEFAYDKLNRHVATLRPNGMRSSYKLDGAGRLRELRHENSKRETLAAFRYAVDGRGNRTQVQELLLEPSATPATDTIAHDDAELLYTGTWTDTTSFHETSQWDARMVLLFVGDEELELVIGEGPDHSIFDIYIDGTLYLSIDGYAASPASRLIPLAVRGDGFHSLELRNRHAKNKQSTAYKLRFQSLSVDTALTQNLIDYSYDQLSRLIEANYNNGTTIYNYGYDVAGNMVDYDGVSRTYNAANQMTYDGTNTLTYDNNGNLRTVGSDTHTWDRANRLLSVGNHSYLYDGVGNRVQQTVSSVLTNYLNDLQPGLTKLLKQDDGMTVEHFVHAPRGIHAVDDGTDWQFYVQDGLGSVRAVVDDSAVVESSMSFDPYGNPMASYGAGFGFTGEQTDANGSVFLRARYYEPGLGMFSALDPFDGLQNRPMSLNGYSWVEGNPVMNVDPSGLQINCDEGCRPQDYVINPSDNIFTRARKIHRHAQCVASDCSVVSPNAQIVTPTPDPFSIPMSTATPDIEICPTPTPTLTSSPTLTSTPSPSPRATNTPARPMVIYFGGSAGGPFADTSDMTYGQTTAPFISGQAPFLSSSADLLVPYPGIPNQRDANAIPPPPQNGEIGKELHALDAVSMTPSGSPLISLGYSAGADSALIFTYRYRSRFSMIGVGLLGGNLDANIINNDGTVPTIGDIDGDGNPNIDWQSMVETLVGSGIRVYILDDNVPSPDFASYVASAPNNQNLCYAQSSLNHFGDIDEGTGHTNRDPNVPSNALTFLRDGDRSGCS